MPPKIDQNPIKIDARRHLILSFKFYSIFDRFFIDFCIPGTPKSLKFIGFYRCFWFSPLSRSDPFLMRFWHQLGSIFPPQILQNPPKIWSQEGSDFSSILASNFYRFWLRFGSQVGAVWAYFFEPRRPKRPPRRPKMLPRRTKTPLKTRLVARIRPDPLQASILIDFWLILIDV